MTPRTRSVLGWIPAVLLAAFLIFASGGPKLFLAQEGSALQTFAEALGVWDILLYVGLLEIAVAILFLIPRTATVGFVLMVSLLGGAMATGLTHEAEGNWPFFPLVLIGVAMIAAWFRSPELLDRLLKRPVPAVSRTWTIVGWISALLVAAMHFVSGVGKFFPIEPGSPQEMFVQARGIDGLEIPLGVLQIVIGVLFLIPRTATVGFVLMVGYWAGVLATHLTRDIPHVETIPVIAVLVLLTVSAYGRNRELITRLLAKRS